MGTNDEKRGQSGMDSALYYTAQQLAGLGENRIPDLYAVTTHLVFSSPATLAYNSPGAEGFGVKRAGLALPDSVMLIVSPPCCGRNTSLISTMPEYRGRFFYLNMDETDLVTGRHLKQIPEAVCQIVASLEKKPSVVMICATCVDALLGTDWDRVSRAAEKAAGVRVRPCYMYALTREGRKPPMVHVRQSLYSLLEKKERDRKAVNFLGFFAPVRESTELRSFLKMAGVEKIREISACGNFEEFQEMAGANFNILLNPECRPAADDLAQKLGMPYVELKRFYDPQRLHRQYRAFFRALGFKEGAGEKAEGRTNVDSGEVSEKTSGGDSGVPSLSDRIYAAEESMYLETAELVRSFHERHPALRLSIGETLNADPFELALALAAEGALIREVFGTVTAESMPYISRLAEISPDTRFYCNQDPSMLYYREETGSIDLTIGKDAGYYHQGSRKLNWNEDLQPFGYEAVRDFYRAMEEALAGDETARAENETARGGDETALAENETVWGGDETALAGDEVVPSAENIAGAGNEAGADITVGGCLRGCPAGGADSRPSRRVHGLRKCLTPFAPDQSGAVSVLYDLGGMTVIVDAGGCAGNICGFDEPRWLLTGNSENDGLPVGAVFSAGLRDMDAILGRDDLLVKKLEEAAGSVKPAFISLIGTPVPAVIATDFQALKRMAERKTGLPVIALPVNGMNSYDKGVEAALLALMKSFAGENPKDGNGKEEKVKEGKASGVLGFTPMDFDMEKDLEALKKALPEAQYGKLYIYGMEGGLDAVRKASSVSRNIVVSPSGLPAAEYLKKKFGIPYRICWPAEAEAELLARAEKVLQDDNGKNILILHQQVKACSLRDKICERAGEAVVSEPDRSRVHVASWFSMLPGLMEKGDIALKEEDDFRELVRNGNYGLIAADPVMKELVPFYEGEWYDEVHFAVSGQIPGGR